ncbi:hypothetical protein Tco_0290426 [Tanacetum coccineum]
MQAGLKPPPMLLTKKNYVPWSSRSLRYAKSDQMKVNLQLYMNGPYVRRMILNQCETAQESGLRVQQMLKGSDIGKFKKRRPKLFQ